jgi:hypothetical protein
MPARHEVDDVHRLIITTWEGDAVDVEFVDALIKYQQDIQVNPNYSDYNEVANFCGVTSIKLTPKGLKTIGSIAAKTDSVKNSCKLALVVCSGVAFNLARIYASYRNVQKKSTKEIRIFKDEVDAIAWASAEFKQHEQPKPVKTE